MNQKRFLFYFSVFCSTRAKSLIIRDHSNTCHSRGAGGLEVDKVSRDTFVFNFSDEFNAFGNKKSSLREQV